MVEFVSVVLNYAEARKISENKAAGLDINVDVSNVRVVGQDMFIDFIYSVKYAGNSGYLKMGGTVLARDLPKTLKDMEKKWKTDRRFPADVAQTLLNVINFSSGVNGVFVSRAVNLPPPLVPPQIQLARPAGAVTPRKKGQQ